MTPPPNEETAGELLSAAIERATADLSTMIDNADGLRAGQNKYLTDQGKRYAAVIHIGLTKALVEAQSRPAPQSLEAAPVRDTSGSQRPVSDTETPKSITAAPAPKAEESEILTASEIEAGWVVAQVFNFKNAPKQAVAVVQDFGKEMLSRGEAKGFERGKRERDAYREVAQKIAREDGPTDLAEWIDEEAARIISTRLKSTEEKGGSGK